MPPRGKSGGSSHSSRGVSHSSPSRPSGSSHSSRSGYSRPSSGLFGSGRPSGLFGSSRPSGPPPGPPPSSGYRKPGLFSGFGGRPYSHQPGYGRRPSSSGLLTALLLRDALHKYTYVPHDYTESDGTTRKSGYYDENGTYYEKGNFENQTMELICPYCDSRSKVTWNEGTLPRCPVCGGAYDEIKQPGAGNAYSSTAPNSSYSQKEIYPSSSKRGGAMKWVAVAALIVLALALFAFIGRTSKPVSQNSLQYAQQNTAHTSAAGSDLYVQEIGRTCTWDSEFEWWVDKKSGCYFYFDDTVSPAQWKYWYEGIGDDFGDYGWMEYDDSQKKWYIETSYQNWQQLPKSYDTKNLWHMKNAYAAP